tara:strand:+ start:588 stop:1229 length:642 start_codon:yes stop_codon:yes gene_type:complete
MDFNILKKRIITSLVLLLIFFIIFFYFENLFVYLIYIIYCLIFIEIIINFTNKKYILFFSIIYLIISSISLNLYFNNYYHQTEFLFCILLVVIFDVTSYFLGSKYGKFKILPIISPNKTLLGLVSGFIISTTFGIIFNYYLKLFEFFLVLIFIFLILISAFLGDIIQSIFKRNCELKNSSNFLPGHGGFFDRFDSFVMVIICLFLFNEVTNIL